MKIIFLDIDGVLNSESYYRQGRDKGPGDTNIDPDAVGRLNQLCESTRAKVVVSSPWRLGRTHEELQAILGARGFTGEVIGKTKDMRRGDDSDCILRGNEVLQWMKAHPVELGCSYWEYDDYVILDDDSDFLYWQRDNLILCDPFVGITPQTVFRAKKILGGSRAPVEA